MAASSAVSKPGLRLFRTACGSDAPFQLLKTFVAEGEGYLCASSASVLRCLAGSLNSEESKRILEAVELSGAARLVAVLKDLQPPGQASQALTCAAVSQAARGMSFPPFDPILGKPGFHRAFASLWRELTAYGAGPADLITAAPEGSDFRVKAESLCSLQDAASELLARLNRSPNSELMKLCIETESDAASEFGRWFICLGGESSPLDAEFVFSVASAGAEVWVIRDNADELIGADDPLEAVFEGQHWERSGESNLLARSIFGGPVPEMSGPEVSFLRAPDPLTECESALKQTSASARNGRRAAVFCRNLEQFGPLLESAAYRLDVLLAQPRPVKLLNQPAAQFFAEILHGLSSDDPRDLEKGLKSAFARLDGPTLASTIAELNSAHAQDNWNSIRSVELPDWLQKTLEWRTEASAEALSMPEWYVRIQALGAILPWNRLIDGEDPMLVEREQRVRNALLRTVASEASVASLDRERRIHFASLTDWLHRLWERAEVILPWDPDGIAVIEDASALLGFDYICAIGMVDGAFPKRSHENPLLSDQERKLISESAGLVVPLPDEESKSLDERREFVRLCAAPKERIDFSFSSLDDERLQLPARFLEEARSVCGNPAFSAIPRYGSALETATSPSERHLFEAIARGEQSLAEPSITQTEVRASLMKKAEGPWKLDALRRVRECPFHALSSDILGLQAGKGNSRYHQLFRIPDEVRLILIESEAQAREVLTERLNERIEDWRPSMPDWEQGFLREAGSRLIEGWVSREFAARERWRRNASDFQSPVMIGSQDRPLSFADRASGAYTMGGRIVLVFYRHAFRGDPTQIFDPEKGGESGLWPFLLAGTAASQKPTFAIELDDSEKRCRTLIAVPRFNLSADIKHGLFVSDPSLADDGSFDMFKNHFRKMTSSMKEWARDIPILPTPGSACDFCGFGELCRSHQQYGETSIGGQE